MSSTMNSGDDAQAEKFDARFDAAADMAREAVRFERLGDDLELGEVLFATGQVPDGTLAETLAMAFESASLKAKTALNEPDADEVDGAAPGDAIDDRTPRTFVSPEAGDDEADEPTFAVAAVYENSYGDDRVAVETPAPWDMPDDHDGDDPNEVVKSLPWGDDDAADADDYDPDAGAFYTFDDDDRAAPRDAADAWAVDKVAVADLKERAEANGYEWNGRGRTEDADENRDDDLLDDAAEYLDAGDSWNTEDGDRVVVRYEQANGNGTNENAGRVVATHDERFRFETEDGKTRYVSRDDDAEPSLYHGGQYPYMGEVVAVTVEPDN